MLAHVYSQAGCHALTENRGVGAHGRSRRADVIVTQGLLEPPHWADVMVTIQLWRTMVFGLDAQQEL
eukprot:2426388-Karenia_brevis.AAC.1